MEGLTTTQVARRLSLSAARVLQLAKAGRIPHQHTPLGRLFDAEAVERIAREREERANGKTA